MFKQIINGFLYLFVAPLAMCLAACLYCLGWKRNTIKQNGSLLLPRLPRNFRWRLLFNLSCDFLFFLWGRYPREIQVRKKDAQRMAQLKSQPSLLLTAHFHNWELMGGWLVKQNVRLLSAARKLESPPIDKLLAQLRNRLNNPTLSNYLPTGALAHLKSGGCFGLIWDQFSPQARVQASLLGQRAAMNPLGAFLHRQAAPAVFFAVILPAGRFRLWQIEKPGGRVDDPTRLARRYHRLLGKVIQAYPTYWYGFCHRRFKNWYPYASNVSRETSAAKSENLSHVSRETW